MALIKTGTETEKLIQDLERLNENPTVLVVEDDPLDMQIATMALESIQCRVIKATDGEAAIRMLTAFHFNLVFLDLKMPGRNGIDVLKQIRKVSIKLPVVVMTHATYSPLIEEAAKLGYIGLIEKPLNQNDVLEVMGKHKL